MRLEQWNKAEYQDILLYDLAHNAHGHYPFFTQKVVWRDEISDVHRHAYFQIQYIANGQLVHCIHDQTFHMTKGDICVIPPYVPHRIGTVEGGFCEIIELEFNPEFINENFTEESDLYSFSDFEFIEPIMLQHSKAQQRVRLSGKAETEIEHILWDLLAEFEEKRPGFELITKSMVLKVLALLKRELTEEMTISIYRDQHKNDYYREAIMRVIHFMETNYMENIYLEDAVKISLLNHTYFSQWFKRVTGKSFSQYLNELRVAKAKELLLYSDLKMLQICISTGFNNLPHFNRTFKQLTSMTPKQYRANGERAIPSMRETFD